MPHKAFSARLQQSELYTRSVARREVRALTQPSSVVRVKLGGVVSSAFEPETTANSDWIQPQRTSGVLFGYLLSTVVSSTWDSRPAKIRSAYLYTRMYFVVQVGMGACQDTPKIAACI